MKLLVRNRGSTPDTVSLQFLEWRFLKELRLANNVLLTRVYRVWEREERVISRSDTERTVERLVQANICAGLSDKEIEEKVTGLVKTRI